MNGALLPNTPIAVDFWQIRRCSHVRLFFLSHMHSDHTTGLTSTWNQPMYCSPVTAKILKYKLQVSNKWINPLEVGQSHLLPLDDVGTETVTVTLIDANHCPGSVMFLFEGYFGTILYTGDFRYSSNMLRYPPLNNRKAIDVLYLDNTNCDPVQNLPSRQEATNQIKEIIKDHPGHDIVIGIYNIGKESLLVDLAKTFKTWVVVSPQRLELLCILEMENVFTSEEGSGRIRLVDQSEVNYANMVRWNKMCPTLAILPTSRKVRTWHKDIHIVPYSDHSSFEELLEFVSRLKPCSIIPVVKTKACETYFQQYLCSSKDKIQHINIPETVKNYMKNRKTFGAMNKCIRVKNKHVPKGVVFESPEKDIHSADINEQKSSPEAFCSTVNSQALSLGNYLKEHHKGHLTFTESTIRSPHRETSPSPSTRSGQSDENMFELPSTICWSPKDRNETVFSDTSFSSPVLRPISKPSHSSPSTNIPFLFNCKPNGWERIDNLSVLPMKRQKLFGPVNFHLQVERYFTQMHSTEEPS
ncbi:hypothetical protein GDO86_003961 [Hymenochirus boettgeri]|uniref:5' exonuclease Apollo n=1 Tax=Hymenochirus boettgeri TaxID=247094 RepID=A0A8T2K2T6_9PIPI|nr:hypothetical protein GDO86_019490 [Hymenochirus boettgeri]KAG8450940.1 hypothetical protein GDO86_003282 [Hymenochirus boettgeri]KAG8450942.1 hypothetical protein GDO86_003284 [Hymenochirus boettgeri]KAG8451974.1 hypothetical protein GDO86_003961 [Hymenochirus boettgeri]